MGNPRSLCRIRHRVCRLVSIHYGVTPVIPILTNFKIDATKPREAFLARHRMQTQVDWYRLITELRGRGHSLATISKAIDVPKHTINGWANGSSPNYTDGLAIIDFWAEEMANPPVTLRINRFR